MAQESEVVREIAPENLMQTEDDIDSCEPIKKKMKVQDASVHHETKLEDRLCGILCCAVCLDLPSQAVYQCVNGHLMCSGCLSHLLADARLKDESATCPNCRCEISKTVCTRNLAVEKAVSELPTGCQFCSERLPRSELDRHERELCLERLTSCRYARIGCHWRGPFHELQAHEERCSHPNKTGAELIGMLHNVDVQHSQEMALYSNIFNLLSFEKITFSDLQMKPYRTDDFITKLFYETSRFTAFNSQWVVKARVNDNNKNPNLSCHRSLTYQLVLKSKVNTPINLQYVALKGPYGEMRVDPAVYQFEFSNDNTETEYMDLPLVDSIECNKQLAAKTINMRLILFHVQK